MSKPAPVKKKSPRAPAPISAGVIVAGNFGPLITPPLRVRAEIRGVVLAAAKARGQWIVHWFSVAKAACVHFNNIRVISGSNKIKMKLVESLINNLQMVYVGDESDLIKVIDENKRDPMSNPSRLPDKPVPIPPFQSANSISATPPVNASPAPVPLSPPAKRSKLSNKATPSPPSRQRENHRRTCDS